MCFAYSSKQAFPEQSGAQRRKRSYFSYQYDFIIWEEVRSPEGNTQTQAKHTRVAVPLLGAEPRAVGPQSLRCLFFPNVLIQDVLACRTQEGVLSFGIYVSVTIRFNPCLSCQQHIPVAILCGNYHRTHGIRSLHIWTF